MVYQSLIPLLQYFLNFLLLMLCSSIQSSLHGIILLLVYITPGCCASKFVAYCPGIGGAEEGRGIRDGRLWNGLSFVCW
jgi:hypothetical protein